MGIRGMRRFIERNKILQPYLLANTRVIVDGNNICHHLLWTGTSRHYGGDYNSLRKQTQAFFSLLLHNKVQPYVVFDGAHDEDDKKLPDTIAKCESRIQENEREIPEHFACVPVLMYETFTMVLKDLKIPHVACEGEADNQIAVLAKQWRCPVISNDSDMYIFDLPGGFVNFSDIPADRTGQIQTRRYLTSEFQNKTGLSAHLLPLVATIFGSTYAEIDQKLIDRFFQHLGAKKRFSSFCRDFKYAFDILKHLRDQDEGMQLMLNCIDKQLQPDAINELKRTIKTSVDYYTVKITETNDIARYFENPSYNKSHPLLPDWIMNDIRTCVISALPIDVTFGRVILKPTLEQFDFPPVQQISLPLRKVIYGIVVKSCPPDKQRTEIKEILRDKRKMTTQNVTPSWDIDGYGSTPSLQEIDNMDQCAKLKLITAIFQLPTETLANTREDSKLFHMTLAYFIKNSNVLIPAFHSKTYSFLHVLLLNKENDPNLRTIYDKVSSHGGDSDLNLDLFHKYLQRFQECLNMTYTINVLVGSPISQPDPSVVYDGLLMYRFFVQYQTEAVVDEIATECFGENPAWSELYNTLSMV